MSLTLPVDFYHGVRRVIDDSAPAPIRPVNVSVIGFVGTAPDADPALFPLDVPVAIKGDEALSAALGKTGTLPLAMDAVYYACGVLASVVVVRVAGEADGSATDAALVGAVDEKGTRTGMQAFLSAKAKTGLAPRAIGAPGHSDSLAVAQGLAAMAERLRGWCFIDAPDTTNAAAKAYAGQFTSHRMADPIFGRPILNNRSGVATPVGGSAFFLGALIRKHFEKNVAWSPSNTPIRVLGLSQDIDWVQGSVSCEANSLNRDGVSTFINDGGWRTWGNGSRSADANRVFITTNIIDDFVGDSIVKAFSRQVDAPITPVWFDTRIAEANAFLADMVKSSVILAGEAWFDGELNGWTSLRQGIARIRYKFIDPSPAQDIQVISTIDPTLFETVFGE